MLVHSMCKTLELKLKFVGSKVHHYKNIHRCLDSVISPGNTLQITVTFGKGCKMQSTYIVLPPFLCFFKKSQARK